MLLNSFGSGKLPLFDSCKYDNETFCNIISWKSLMISWATILASRGHCSLQFISTIYFKKNPGQELAILLDNNSVFSPTTKKISECQQSISLGYKCMIVVVKLSKLHAAREWSCLHCISLHLVFTTERCFK